MMPEITDIFSNSRSERRFDPEIGNTIVESGEDRYRGG